MLRPLSNDLADDLEEDTYYWLRVLVDGSTIQAMIEGRRSTRIQYEMDVNLDETFIGVGGFDQESIYSALEVYPASGGGASDTAAVDALQLTLENVVDNAEAAIASSGSVYRSHVGLAAADLDTQLAVADTINAKLGSITGSGDNTILGLILALAKSDAATPSDIGGTYDPSTDSLQAVRDRGDAEWTGSGDGDGEFTVSLTIKDSSNNPVPDCDVVISSGSAGSTSGRITSGTTNVSGVISFELDAGTYYVWRQRAGYSFTNPVTLVVDSNGDATVS